MGCSTRAVWKSINDGRHAPEEPGHGCPEYLDSWPALGCANSHVQVGSAVVTETSSAPAWPASSMSWCTKSPGVRFASLIRPPALCQPLPTADRGLNKLSDRDAAESRRLVHISHLGQASQVHVAVQGLAWRAFDASQPVPSNQGGRWMKSVLECARVVSKPATAGM